MTLSLSSARASALSGISGVSHDALKPPKACLPLTKTMVIKPGIRCRQRIELSGLVAHQVSASSGFVLLWAGWASRRLVHAVHSVLPPSGFKRRFSHL